MKENNKDYEYINVPGNWKERVDRTHQKNMAHMRYLSK